MKKLHLEAFALPPLPTNCYIIHDGDQALAIDPGAPSPVVRDFLHSRRITLTHILLTHLHSDHTAGAAPLARAFHAGIFASKKDGWMLDDYLGKGDDDWSIPAVERFTFQHLAQGDLAVFNRACRVLETPGHSPGGLTFYFKTMSAIFPGDTLFRKTHGRTDFSGGDRLVIMKSLCDVIFPLPGSTMVYPGHGRPFLLREALLFQEHHDSRP